MSGGEWVALDDRLPAVGKLILACGPESTLPYPVMLREGIGFISHDPITGRVVRVTDVTHWLDVVMPFPVPAHA